jgi:hypothetical protein
MWHSEHLGVAQGVRTHEGLTMRMLPQWGTEQPVITAVSWENLRFALVAQGIEHRFPKPCVACSNHAGGTAEVPARRPLTRENLMRGRSCPVRLRPVLPGQLRPSVPYSCPGPEDRALFVPSSA